MKAGIKIGPDKTWQRTLEKSQASYVEVYFVLPRYKEFKEMFSYLKNHKINFGLHFWAKLTGDFMPNLAFGGKIAGESVKLIKQTLEIARKIGAHYVNVHPGGYKLKKVDFKAQKFIVTQKRIEETSGKQELFKNAKLLHHFGQKMGVLFLIETICKLDLADWLGKMSSRLNPQNPLNVDAQTLYELAKKEKIFITNDFGHTLTETISDDRDLVFENLYQQTRKLAPFTKLIHANTSPAPFNGTDAHAGLLDVDFAQNVLPNKKEIIKLFKLFKNRDDVWVVPEPLKDHVANYKSLLSLLSESSSALFQDCEKSSSA